MTLRIYVPADACADSIESTSTVAMGSSASAVTPVPGLSVRARTLARMRGRLAVGSSYRPAAVRLRDGQRQTAAAAGTSGVSGSMAAVCSPAKPAHEQAVAADVTESQRIAAIVAQVMASMAPQAHAVPSLSGFLEATVLPQVAKKTERDARSLSVRRFHERVGCCSKCRISWRLDADNGDRCPRCGDTRMTDPGIDLVDQAALATLAGSLLDDEVSPGTVRKQITYLMAVLNKAAELQLIRKVRKPRIRQVESVIRVLSEQELLGLYNACSAARWPRHSQFAPADWWRAFLVMALLYGMRLGELTSLPWSEPAGSRKLARGLHTGSQCPHPELRHLALESAHGWLVYLPAKQSDAKPLPLVLPLRDIAAQHLQAIRGDRHFVFDCYAELKTHKPGDYRDVKISLYRQWDALCTAAGIALRATPHDLRRTQETLYDTQCGKGLGGEVNGHAARSVSDAYYSQAVPRIHKAVLGVQLPAFGSC